MVIENSKKIQETFAQELCDLMTRLKIITDKESAIMHQAFKESEHAYFESFLLEQGLVSKEDLLRSLSMYFKVPSFDVNGHFFNSLLVRLFPKDLLTRHAVIPLEIDQDMLIVVASYPEEPGLESALRQHITYDIEYLVGMRQGIIDAVQEFYDLSPVHDSDFDDMTLDQERHLERKALDEDREIEEVVEGNRFYDGEEDKG